MRPLLRRLLLGGWQVALAGSVSLLAGCPVSTDPSSLAPASSDSTAAGTTASSGAGGNTIATAASNVVPITIDAGPANTYNVPFVSVTVCAPGSSVNCRTIDHVLIDTGSSGLRIIASALPAPLELPPQSDASGAPMAECAVFADGFTWGSVKLADVKVGGELASSIPIQLIGDPAFPTIPAACSSTGAPENTVATFGSKGVLGVGLFKQDCGSFCAQSTAAGVYYACPASGCQSVLASIDAQVQNPVAKFAVDNNGVIIQLPAVSSAGAASVTGALVFGIGTQTNNGLGTATVFNVDASTGHFTTAFNSRRLSNSFIDSGSSLYFLPDTGTPLCTGTRSSGLYCPATTQSLSATNQGLNGTSGSVAFSVANAQNVLTGQAGITAFNNLAAPNLDPNGFVWGLPFFLGRNVYTAIEASSTPGGTGPYFAY